MLEDQGICLDLQMLLFRLVRPLIQSPKALVVAHLLLGVQRVASRVCSCHHLNNNSQVRTLLQLLDPSQLLQTTIAVCLCRRYLVSNQTWLALVGSSSRK